MLKRLKNIFPVSVLLLLITGVLGAASAGERPTVTISPTPGWVETVAFDAEGGDHEIQRANGEYFLLMDHQVRMTGQRESFYHYAIKLTNEEAVDDNARISVVFSPSYQELSLHRIRIVRDGHTFGQLHADKIDLLQREEQLDELIYDGRWTASMILEDVRKGDILEYSYSIRGENPAYQGHFSQRLDMQWTVPLHQQFYRLLWPDDRPLSLLPVNTQKDVELIQHAGYKEYRFQQAETSSLLIDSDASEWFDPWARVNFSSVSDWAEVVQWALPYYELQERPDRELLAQVQAIRKQHPNKIDQVSAALHFVQDEIRYLGIEIGINGIAPRPPDLTLQRRYGDCKDKTTLLLHMLKELDIKAYPALVHTRYGKTLDEDGPRANAFNHVLVQAQVDGRSYWLDPTINNQKGPINTLYQPDYDLALVLAPETKKLTSMSQAQEGHLRVIDEVVDLRKGVNETAVYSITTVYHGLEAERFRKNINSQGREQIQKGYLEYYSDFYPDIEALSDIAITDNHEKNQITVEERYRVPGYWEDNEEQHRHQVNLYSSEIYPLIKTPDVRRRSSPYSVSYPAEVEQNITVLLPDTWQLEDDSMDLETPFFQYRRSINYDAAGKELQLRYYFKSLKDTISATDAKAYIESIAKVEEDLDYSIYSTYQDGASGTHDDATQEENGLDADQILMIVGASILVLFIIAYIDFRIDARKSPGAANASYYTVSSFKFFVLSLLTLGLYQVYWFYKNWRYVKIREQSSIMPWARALFCVFWYYPLYKSIGRDESFTDHPVPSKTNYLFLFLAIVYLLTSVLNYRDDIYFYLIDLVAVASMLPLVERINALYAHPNAYYRFNSRWRVRHAIFAGVFGLLIAYNAASSINLIPNDAVVNGSALWNRDIRFMQRSGALDADEELLMFYSDGFLSFQDDGNGITERGVLSYWRDDYTDELNIESAAYRDIADIEYAYGKNGDYTTINIIRHDGSDFILYITSTKGQDKKFTRRLQDLWDMEKDPLSIDQARTD